MHVHDAAIRAFSRRVIPPLSLCRKAAPIAHTTPKAKSKSAITRTFLALDAGSEAGHLLLGDDAKVEQGSQQNSRCRVGCPEGTGPDRPDTVAQVLKRVPCQVAAGAELDEVRISAGAVHCGLERAET